MSTKNCKECPNKQIFHGDFDSEGNQLFYCNKYRGYVTNNSEILACEDYSIAIDITDIPLERER